MWLDEPRPARAERRADASALPPAGVSPVDRAHWNAAVTTQLENHRATQAKLTALIQAVRALSPGDRDGAGSEAQVVAAIGKLAEQQAQLLEQQAAELRKLRQVVAAIDIPAIPELPAPVEPAAIPQPLRVTDAGRIEPLLEAILDRLEARPTPDPIIAAAPPAPPAPAPEPVAPEAADVAGRADAPFADWQRARPVIRNFADHLLAGRYEQAVELFSPDYRKDMTPEQMSRVIEPIRTADGALASLGAHQVVAIDNADHHVAWRTELKTTGNRRVTLTVTLDADGQIVGLFLQRQPD
jgi:hypothetical protein